MKRVNTFLASILLLVAACSCSNTQRNFAIIVDPSSYIEAQSEIDAYAEAIKKFDNMNCTIIEDIWSHPDSIRVVLKQLHEDKNIEGFVLIGDIPVAMIRDAQHLTSAFKMNQSSPRIHSSIPSDRFYDNLDLEFTYIDKEADLPYYYYSLNYDSPQRLDLDMYSGRIRPMTEDGRVDYDALKAYLRKVVSEKASLNSMDHTFFFSGHGYISESLVARIDEQEGIYDHFPWLKGQQDRVGYIDHGQYNPVKTMLMTELMREELDYAIIHHHGHWDTQYLNGAPKVQNITQAKEYILRYFRSQLSRGAAQGKDTDAMIRDITNRYDVPRSWVSNFNDAEIIAQDSIFNAGLDLVLEDFNHYNYQPNVRTLIIDACFCGAFQQNSYIAGRYIFNTGKTVACIANSVNVLQDKWSDKFVGLLGLGAPIGQLVRYNPYLESHVIGDPTFTFVSSDQKYNVGKMLACYTSWRKELKSDYADIRNLAMVELYDNGEMSSDELLQIYKSSKEGVVRTQALELLARCRDHNFIEAVKLAVNDGYEMTQRFAIKYISKSGDPELIKALISVCMANNTSERTNFNLTYALSLYRENELLEEFDNAFNSEDIKYINKESVGETIRQAIINSSSRWNDDIDDIFNPESNDRAKGNSIRVLRNYGVHHQFEALIDHLPNLNEELQIMLIEALGWHKESYMRTTVVEKLTTIASDDTFSEAVRHEAIKTCKRLE